MQEWSLLPILHALCKLGSALLFGHPLVFIHQHLACPHWIGRRICRTTIRGGCHNVSHAGHPEPLCVYIESLPSCLLRSRRSKLTPAAVRPIPTTIVWKVTGGG